MKGYRRAAAIAGALLIAATSHAGTAQAASSPKLKVTPATVQAGGVVNVRVSRAHGRRCTLTFRIDHKGALVDYRKGVRGGTIRVGIPASVRAGRRVAVVRCGSRKGSTRFTITAAATGGPPAAAGPTPIAPDEQGFIGADTGTQAEAPTGQQLGGGDYDNARIADIGLSKEGQNLYTPGWLDHGQCKQAVNDWVAEASGRTQVMGGDYYANYARNGGTQVARDDAAKGDIIQIDNPSDISNYYKGMHTAVVVSHGAGSNTFDVVDSNFHLDDVVRHHAWDPYAAAAKYGRRVTIWRMGTVSAPSQPTQPTQPTQPSQPTQPAPPQTWGETAGGVAHTWTNPANAGGTQGPSIGGGQTVQIACKLQGFRVADGNTWWYRIAQAPWNSQYYVSADAFYNNGATSGSLHGTPFVDGAVRDC